ncbi:hypothetical protein NOVOSPHI9U_40367 [Novosphingobium sp. 9U]|nr:hypothetical protein NOVOSPHI9U_40367 [Novosphingobium sp. 9U]
MRKAVARYTFLIAFYLILCCPQNGWAGKINNGGGSPQAAAVNSDDLGTGRYQRG